MAKRLEKLKEMLEGFFFFSKCNIPNVQVPKTENCIFFMEAFRGNGKDKRKKKKGEGGLPKYCTLYRTKYKGKKKMIIVFSKAII